MARKACGVRTGVRGGLSRLLTASITSRPWQLRRLTPFLLSSLDPPALWMIPHYLLAHSSCPSGLSPSSHTVLPSTLSHHQSTFPGRLSSLLPPSPRSKGEVPSSMLTWIWDQSPGGSFLLPLAALQAAQLWLPAGHAGEVAVLTPGGFQPFSLFPFSPSPSSLSVSLLLGSFLP